MIELTKKLNRENILAYFLGAVVLWFGLGEIINTKDYIGFAPMFLGSGAVAYTAVVAHGVILTISGLMLVANFKRRFAAGVLSVILLEIIVDLIIGGIGADIIVRDIGLLGMALTLLYPSNSNK